MFICGDIVSVSRFELANKSGTHEGEIIDRVLVTIDCKGPNSDETFSTASDDLSCVTFMKGKGDHGYKELNALEGGENVKIRASAVTESNGYLNVQFDAMWVAGEGDTREYVMPTITHKQTAVVARTVAI